MLRAVLIRVVVTAVATAALSSWVLGVAPSGASTRATPPPKASGTTATATATPTVLPTQTPARAQNCLMTVTGGTSAPAGTSDVAERSASGESDATAVSASSSLGTNILGLLGVGLASAGVASLVMNRRRSVAFHQHHQVR